MARSFATSSSGSIDREHRLVGRWGLAAAAFGLLTLLLALASYTPD